MGNPILVVDDEPELRNTLGDLLRDAGYPVVVAKGRADAARLLSSERLVPSLLLLDLLLPVLSGNELFARMQTRPELAELPVLVMTASRTVELPKQVTAVLRKPYRADRLLAVVDGLCGRSPIGRAEAALRARELRMGGASVKAH
jgi:CheY-like chemotaxis protein